jgi:Pyruvate/2-oxoacid:ferredoxin oxidoreductase delta subunit
MQEELSSGEDRCARMIASRSSMSSYHCMRHAGKLCIEVNPGSKIAWISEELCIGCGICVKVGVEIACISHFCNSLCQYFNGVSDGLMICACQPRNALLRPS